MEQAVPEFWLLGSEIDRGQGGLYFHALQDNRRQDFCTHIQIDIIIPALKYNKGVWSYKGVSVGRKAWERGYCLAQRSIQAPTEPDPGPASQLSVPQAEIKASALANPPGRRHCVAPAAAVQEQPQHALLRLGKGAERFMGWMRH